MEDLKGKTALVTGASRGIGAAAAMELARHGVAVVLAARGEARLATIKAEIETAGGRAAVAACDVGRYDDVANAVALCRERFGDLDILVNNAGVIEPIARLVDSAPAEWAMAVDINLKGVYHGLRAALPAMLEKGAGTIVNISSGAATGVLEGWSSYCATKAAVLSLTRSADLEYRGHGIRVLGLSPGTVATDMQVAIRESGINPVSQLDPSVHIPAAWAGRAVAWLCTAEADPFLGTDFGLRPEENRALVGLGT